MLLDCWTWLLVCWTMLDGRFYRFPGLIPINVRLLDEKMTVQHDFFNR